MQYTIEKEIPGRIRVKLVGPVPQDDLGALEAVLAACPDIASARVYPRIGSIAIVHEPGEAGRLRTLKYLCDIDRSTIDAAREGHSLSTTAQSHNLLLDIAWLAGTYLVRRWVLPMPLSFAWNLLAFIPFARAAARSLAAGTLDVPVLDATAIATSFVQRDPKTAGETMFLLQLGETTEAYTEARSESALSDALLDVAETANKVEDGTEVQVNIADLKQGDLIAVRTGMPIVVDGVIESGLAMVNQSSLTGEPLAIERAVGDDVFAGTSVEDGEILVRCKAGPGESRLRSIVSLVKNADLYQSAWQARRAEMAARIVPWNFLLAGIVALTTRSIVKTSAALMVDYSCGSRGR